MLLTFANRMKIIWEVLTITSGHPHTAQEKRLSTFMRGYESGWKDAMFHAEEKEDDDEL